MVSLCPQYLKIDRTFSQGVFQVHFCRQIKAGLRTNLNWKQNESLRSRVCAGSGRLPLWLSRTLVGQGSLGQAGQNSWMQLSLKAFGSSALCYCFPLSRLEMWICPPIMSNWFDLRYFYIRMFLGWRWRLAFLGFFPYSLPLLNILGTELFAALCCPLLLLDGNNWFSPEGDS